MNLKKLWPFSKSKKSKTTRPYFRGYNAADMGRLLSDWVSSGASMDSELRGALPKIRNRSRELVRNNDHAKSVIRAFGNNVIGEGVRMQSQVLQARGGGKLDEKINSQIETQWEKWGKKINCHTEGQMDFHDIAKMLVEQVFEAGEIYVRFIYQKFGDSKVPLSLEIIEADKLDDDYNLKLAGESYIKMGVEKNQWGRPIGYHFYQTHPGETGIYSGFQKKRVRIPADEVIPLFPVSRPGQTRGVPVLASAMVNLHHMAGYQEGEVVTARATSSLMGFIESPTGDALADDVDTNTGEKLTSFEPAVFKYLGPGEKMNVPNIQRPSGQFEPFVRAMLRSLGAGSGISYETISRDYSQSNYSSTRQALVEDRDNYKIIQKWIIRHFYQIVFEKWLDLAVLSGAVKIKNYELAPDLYKAPKWMPRGWSWIDPLKEVMANKAAVRAGFKTQSEVISEMGGDYDQFIQMREREVKIAKEKGLVFDSDAALVDNAGAGQVVDPGGASDPGSTADNSSPPAE